jgi:hypothetical protein
VQEPAGELEGEAVVVLVVPAVGQGAGYPRLGDDDVAVGEHGGDIEGAVGDEHGTEFLGQEPHDPVPADHVRGAVADGQGGGVAWRGEPLGFGREDGADLVRVAGREGAPHGGGTLSAGQPGQGGFGRHG